MNAAEINFETAYFKVLDVGGSAFHGGYGKWSLPTQDENGSWQPGEWMPHIKTPQTCVRGYHLCQLKDLLQWAGPTTYVAQIKPRASKDVGNDKVAVSSARLLYPIPHWNDRALRHFACDCVEHALDNMKQPPPDADKMREVLRMARAVADGKATQTELYAARAAARAAAWDAAWVATWDAARAAAWDAARATARAAAWDAARDAAWDAARAAAWAAARDAEQEWQRKRLVEYLRGEVLAPLEEAVIS